MLKRDINYKDFKFRVPETFLNKINKEKIFMPITYIWVPSKDPDMEWFAEGQCKEEGVRYLKRPTQNQKDIRYGLRNKVARWSEVKNGDHLLIGGHGRATSSKQIGWIGKPPHDDIVFWGFDELATAVGGLCVTNGITHLTFTLCMCWGADSIGLFDTCFAGRFASALRKYNIKGNVTAYPGKMVINGFSSEIVINGTSRVSSARGKFQGKPMQLVNQVRQGNVPRHAFAENVCKSFPVPS
jgi:hypothetical protein